MTDALDLPGDRGVREIHDLSEFDHLSFGLAIAEFQAHHPNTLARFTANLHRSTGLWDVRVKWWQRGTDEP